MVTADDIYQKMIIRTLQSSIAGNESIDLSHNRGNDRMLYGMPWGGNAHITIEHIKLLVVRMTQKRHRRKRP